MRIYLDHNATTPLRDEVVDAMAKSLRDLYGNPSSTHAEGAAAKAALARAREQVAACLGTEPAAITFTAGATEANNTVLAGLASAGDGPSHVVTSSVEHPSVSEPCEALESADVAVTRLSVDTSGLLRAAEVFDALRPETKLVSLIWANNETGVVQPIEEIAAGLEARGVPLHVDATQAIGKWPIDLSKVSAAYLSCSAHKFNGPKGTGCLVARTEAPPPALMRGGPQERRRRGGTENLAGIIGMGVAAELAQQELKARMRDYATLRDRLWAGIQKEVPDVHRNGSSEHVLPNTLNVEFRGAAGEVLLEALDLEGVAVSAGAACHSGAISPSHVLTAMGRTPEQARGCLRLSVGHGIDAAAIDRVCALLGRLVPRARALEQA
jgi:cysteine desulfurase